MALELFSPNRLPHVSFFLSYREAVQFSNMKESSTKFLLESFVTFQSFLRHHTGVVQPQPKCLIFPWWHRCLHSQPGLPSDPGLSFPSFQWQIHGLLCMRLTGEKNKSLSDGPRSPHRPVRIISCPVTGSPYSQMELWGSPLTELYVFSQR